MPSAASPHFLSVLQAAVELGAPVARRIVGRAAEALLRSAAAAEPAERRLLVDANRLLTQRRDCFCSAYAVCLRREFEALDEGEPLRAALTFGELQRMAEDQVEATFEAARAQQLVRSAVGPELARLDALVCGARGRATVTPSANPLRPQAWLQAVRSAALHCEVPPALLARWLPRLSEALTAELASVYRELSQALQRQDVAEAACAPPRDAPAAALPAPLLNLHDLWRLLAEREPPTRWPAVGEEAMRVMVDAMAADERLVPPVQQALRELQPALLRLARQDARFFRDPRHPARQLLAEITERSLAWPPAAELAGCPAFLQALRETVTALAPVPAGTAEAFEHALRRLEGAWAATEERSQRERADAARALIKAERRNLLASRVAERLHHRPDVARAAGHIRSFLAGPWAQVMAAAQLADPSGSPDPGGYGAVIDDLLWISRNDPALQDRTRPASVVPGLLAALRGGLASIEYPEGRTREFLRQLDPLHRVSPPPPDGPEAVPARAAEPGGDEPGPPLLWVEPTEGDASNLMEAVPPADRAALSQQAAGDAEPGADRRPPLPAALARLHAGAWVDLFLQGRWSRWRLAWSSPHSVFFMFADGAGRHRSMTRAVLETLLAAGGLRFVCEQTVADSALDAVAAAALRNSLQGVR